MGWTTEELLFDCRETQDALLFSKASKPGVESTQAPIQWIRGDAAYIWKSPGAEVHYVHWDDLISPQLNGLTRICVFDMGNTAQNLIIDDHFIELHILQ
jgi:hypothetical protein